MLSMVVRVSIDGFKTNDYFFGLVKVQAADAQTLYATITEYFTRYDINYKDNLIICS